MNCHSHKCQQTFRTCIKTSRCFHTELILYIRKQISSLVHQTERTEQMTLPVTLTHAFAFYLLFFFFSSFELKHERELRTPNFEAREQALKNIFKASLSPSWNTVLFSNVVTNFRYILLWRSSDRLATGILLHPVGVLSVSILFILFYLPCSLTASYVERYRSKKNV